MTTKGLCRYGLLVKGEPYAVCAFREGHNRSETYVSYVRRIRGHRLMGRNGLYINAPYLCAHCGRPMGDFEGGYGTIGDGERVCHPNAQGRPDCYRLITTYHEVLGVRSNETELRQLTVSEAQAILKAQVGL